MEVDFKERQRTFMKMLLNVKTERDIWECCKEFDYLYEEGLSNCLHIMLGDGNFEDVHVEFCLTEAVAADDCFAVELCELILTIPECDRWKIWEYMHGNDNPQHDLD